MACGIFKQTQGGNFRDKLYSWEYTHSLVEITVSISTCSESLFKLTNLTKTKTKDSYFLQA